MPPSQTFAPCRDCDVCTNRLPDRYHGLSCRHAVCRSCIIHSERPECPICRSSVLLTRSEKREHERINELRRTPAPSDFDDGLGFPNAPFQLSLPAFFALPMLLDMLRGGAFHIDEGSDSDSGSE